MAARNDDGRGAAVSDWTTTVEAFVARTTESSGVPVNVEDEAALAVVVRIVYGHRP